MATKQAKTSKARTLADHPAYVASKERLENLRSQHSIVNSKLVEAVNNHRRAERSVSQLEGRARAVLRGEDPDDTAKVAQGSFRELDRDAQVLSRAVELASREHEREWTAASHSVISDRISEHKELVKAIAEHLEGLANALASEQKWVDSLRSEGVKFTSGAGGTVSPISRDTAALFGLLRKMRVEKYRQRLVQHKYIV